MKLKKCPFCGGEAEINICTFTDEYIVFYPRCKDRNCIANIIHGVGSKTKEEAAEKWNRRAEE